MRDKRIRWINELRGLEIRKKEKTVTRRGMCRRSRNNDASPVFLHPGAISWWSSPSVGDSFSNGRFNRLIYRCIMRREWPPGAYL